MEFRWRGVAGRVVETEAYAERGDEACHTFFRPSARRFVDEHREGTAYVYLNYGMYWLTNVLVVDRVSGSRGFVLLRALEPLRGRPAMRRRRGRERDRDLCSGPGKLSMAFGIEGPAVHGFDFADPGDARRGFFLPAGLEEPEPCVVADRRIGISRSQELPWRFCLAGSEHLSVPPGRGR
jgi:DNA-3-methyladenine glycosylase